MCSITTRTFLSVKNKRSLSVLQKGTSRYVPRLTRSHTTPNTHLHLYRSTKPSTPAFPLSPPPRPLSPLRPLSQTRRSLPGLPDIAPGVSGDVGSARRTPSAKRQTPNAKRQTRPAHHLSLFTSHLSHMILLRSAPPRFAPSPHLTYI
jgi:hypothetical protein